MRPDAQLSFKEHKTALSFLIWMNLCSHLDHTFWGKQCLSTRVFSMIFTPEGLTLWMEWFIYFPRCVSSGGDSLGFTQQQIRDRSFPLSSPLLFCLRSWKPAREREREEALAAFRLRHRRKEGRQRATSKGRVGWNGGKRSFGLPQGCTFSCVRVCPLLPFHLVAWVSRVPGVYLVFACMCVCVYCYASVWVFAILCVC